MRWLIERNAVEQAVRLGGVLYPMWVYGGYLTEGRAHLRTLLTLPGASGAASDWAQLNWSGGYVEFFAGEYAEARARLERAVAVRRTLGDQVGLAGALSYLGQAAREQADYEPARAWLDESLALFQNLGDELRDAGPPRDDRPSAG